MSSVDRFPDNAGFFIVKIDNRSVLRVIRHTLTDFPVFFNHKNTIHVRYLCTDLVGIADIPHSFHTLRIHLLFPAEPFIQDTQGLCDMPLQKLIPGKLYHLFPVSKIQVSGLLFIGHQIGIQKGRFLIVQRISMHEIK